MLLEIACFSLESAIAAAEAGADRIEFCKNYAIGGRSPSVNDFSVLRQKTTRPIYVMIRTRSGNFVYSKEELETMRDLILQFKKLGANGFVFGCLTEEGGVHAEACRKLLDAAGSLPCTFHRAIDETKNMETSFEDIIELGFSSVLTSGKNCTAELGMNVLKNLQSNFGHKIEIIVGGGVRSTNIGQLLESRCTAYHSAALDENKELSLLEIQKLKTTLSAYEKN